MGVPCRNGVGDVIVISGVLLLVAVVFLIIGLFGPLAWVYASIGVSVLSFAFLLLGVRQRRVAPIAATGSAPALPTAPTATAAPALSRDDEVNVLAQKTTPTKSSAAAKSAPAKSTATKSTAAKKTTAKSTSAAKKTTPAKTPAAKKTAPRRDTF